MKMCTCTDTSCPYNPVNHDKGCTPCIAKNLKMGELPSCFFVAVQGHDEYPAYTYQHFARVVADNLGMIEVDADQTV